jgi:hypothetical protein
MVQENDILPSDIDDNEKTIEYIKNYLPQDLKEKFDDDTLYYFLDLIDEFYVTKGLMGIEPDGDGYINVDLEELADYIVKESKKNGMGEYDPDEVFFVVQGEMEYVDSFE